MIEKIWIAAFYYFCVAIPLFILWLLLRYKTSVRSHWSHGFDGIQFSSQEFYQSVVTSLESRKIPDISTRYTTHAINIKTIVFDKRREYLCISRGEYEFQVCAAPFGTGFFVSWWFMERERGYITLLRRIPLLRLLLSIKTFYQIDVEEMYRTFVHMCVLEVIDQMTTSKGVRGLNEYERRIPQGKD